MEKRRVGGVGGSGQLEKGVEIGGGAGCWCCEDAGSGSGTWWDGGRGWRRVHLCWVVGRPVIGSRVEITGQGIELKVESGLKSKNETKVKIEWKIDTKHNIRTRIGVNSKY
ncbi:hypothetical protein EVAR_100792_1 [Eumeta japonica]|uniref:Uncharacterized protein n=1 Tax=Eumeta variegata TaxID=151549 RepID=A0A4C1SR68_EUMVA|nr:hypothetical protein EVAR_100792_1 [Eumeta japonica]